MITFNLSELAVRERAVTLFLIVAIAVAGTFAFFKLGRAEDPTFTIKVLTVTTAWPGATAQEMQDLVAEPLEKRLQELRWYDRVETMTRPGLAFMTLTLKDRTPPAEVSEQFVPDPKPMKSTTVAPKGQPLPLRAVVVLTRATLPAFALMLMLPVASGVGRLVVPPDPAASCTR